MVFLLDFIQTKMLKFSQKKYFILQKRSKVDIFKTFPLFQREEKIELKLKLYERKMWSKRKEKKISFKKIFRQTKFIMTKIVGKEKGVG